MKLNSLENGKGGNPVAAVNVSEITARDAKLVEHFNKVTADEGAENGREVHKENDLPALTVFFCVGEGHSQAEHLSCDYLFVVTVVVRIILRIIIPPPRSAHCEISRIY